MPRQSFHLLLNDNSGLNAFKLETLLLSTGVIQWRGEETQFSLSGLENLQATFPTATSLHIQRHRLVRGNPKHYFLCIDRPHQNSNPRTQLQNANCQVTQRPRRSNQLDPAVLTAIRDLCTLREQEDEESVNSSDDNSSDTENTLSRKETGKSEVDDYTNEDD